MGHDDMLQVREAGAFALLGWKGRETFRREGGVLRESDIESQVGMASTSTHKTE